MIILELIIGCIPHCQSSGIFEFAIESVYVPHGRS